MKVQYVDRISRNLFSYDDEPKLQWSILPDKEKVGAYNAQKATTEFGGRKWTAWFTTDLPYQDGPYKFGGLPGLIVKVEDDKGDYSFDLMKNYKIAEFPTLNQFGNTLKVKRTDYLKQQQKFKADPMSFMSQGAGGISAPMRVGGGRGPGGGGNQNPADMRKRRSGPNGKNQSQGEHTNHRQACWN